MSFILDALRKAEIERRQGKNHSSVELLAMDAPAEPRAWWPWALLGTTILIGVGLWGWINRSGTPPPSASPLAAIGQVAPTPSPAPPPMPSSAPPHQATPPVPVRPTVAQQTAPPAPPPAPPPAQDSLRISGKVVGVHLDCMLEVSESGGKIKKIRLGGVTCPDPSTLSAKQTRELTSQMIFTKTVTMAILELDAEGVPQWEVFSPDGQSLNAMLVRYGLAKAIHPRFHGLEEAAIRERSLPNR